MGSYVRGSTQRSVYAGQVKNTNFLQHNMIALLLRFTQDTFGEESGRSSLQGRPLGEWLALPEGGR